MPEQSLKTGTPETLEAFKVQNDQLRELVYFLSQFYERHRTWEYVVHWPLLPLYEEIREAGWREECQSD